MSQPKGIIERIKTAESFQELDLYVRELNSFMYAAAKTRRKAMRAANRRQNELRRR